MHLRRIATAALIAALGTTLTACEDGPSENAAPASSALAPAAPKTAESMTFAVATDASEATFLMEAPIEKIHGEAPESISGELFIDLKDVTKSTGLIKIDLDQLVLYQQKRADEEGDFSERTKSDKQNEHARTWLQISEDAPPEQREQFRHIEFKLETVETKGPKDVTVMTGAERKLDVTVTGDFRLHGRAVKKTALLTAVFTYEGETPVSLRVESKEPIPVSLEEHDVRPRSAFDKLAQATLASLGEKVAEAAPVRIEFTAKAAGDGA